MTRLFFLFLFLFSSEFYSQTLNLNNPLFENNLRRAQLNGDINSNISFTLRPLDLNYYDYDKDIFDYNQYSPTVLSFLNGSGKLKILPVDYNINYSSHHPYNRNNGSMITNRGYQQLISTGLFFELGPLSIQLKPEHIYAENKDYDGFWEGHYDVTWARRYTLWNRIDMPERFGEEAYKKTTFGQSSIRLNYKTLSIGLSSENIWWGPSIRNGIMLSNNAQGFNHITFNTRRPINTAIGNFEFQLVTGRLEPSGFDPPSTDRTYAGTKLFIPKKTQNGKKNDWRFFQGYSITYSPKWITGLHIGLNRWLQMYGEMYDGKYWWINEDPRYEGASIGWFPIFNNFLRKNDKVEPFEKEIDQAASGFFRWVWEDSKAEIYGEFSHNDSKFNFRDLLSDSDHSRAVTLGLIKLFDSKYNDYQIEFNWEWTQMEQTASRLVRNAGSWYMHGRVYHGYTNNGEVMGAGIGPGSNSQYFSISKINENQRLGGALEIIDQDNDFYYK
ncbi:MAG: capsule assembly Wzi family protein, partial [Flavobacteriales bacterium]|nr:capsule assembly Wzi family protein [Flavobacteriales bacterium]